MEYTNVEYKKTGNNIDIPENEMIDHVHNRFDEYYNLLDATGMEPQHNPFNDQIIYVTPNKKMVEIPRYIVEKAKNSYVRNSPSLNPYIQSNINRNNPVESCEYDNSRGTCGTRDNVMSVPQPLSSMLPSLCSQPAELESNIVQPNTNIDELAEYEDNKYTPYVDEFNRMKHLMYNENNILAHENIKLKQLNDAMKKRYLDNDSKIYIYIFLSLLLLLTFFIIFIKMK